MDFFLGLLCGIGGLLAVALIVTSAEKSVCKANGYAGAYCQCRITLGYDDSPRK
jgi:hypothetical protein